MRGVAREVEEGGAELCEGTMERVGCEGRTAVRGGGVAAAILSRSSGGGERDILVCAAALAPLPHTSQEARAMLASLSSCIYYY